MISQLSTSSSFPPIDHNTKGCSNYRWLQGFLHLTTRYRVSPTSQTIKDLEMFFFSEFTCLPFLIDAVRTIIVDIWCMTILYRCDSNYSVILTSNLPFLSPIIRLHKFHLAEYPMKNHEKGDYEVFTQQLPAPMNELKFKRSTGFLASFCGYQWFCIIFFKCKTSF